MQSEISKIKKIVKENKPYLEALEELDRTGKLRKISYKERVNFTIDENILNKFRNYCEKKGYKMSNLVERMMIEKLKK
tara:strand:+ start:693 stop:926 length:234 start_codon:yes stop_codon:yes gene_type:complete